MLMMTTPAEIGDTVSLLTEQFGLADAVWVPVRPRKDSVVQDCYKDVERQVAEFGGEIVYGWEVWEWPRIMIAAEFHAVWRSPTGELSDVTIKPDGEQQIVFIPDASRTYNARQIDNLRLALWDHNLVHEFIKVCEQLYRLRDDNRISEQAFIDTNEHKRLKHRKDAIQLKLMSFPRARTNA
jgi:hypothetical protein